jgi:hypothetical protein
MLPSIYMQHHRQALRSIAAVLVLLDDRIPAIDAEQILWNQNLH